MERTASLGSEFLTAYHEVLQIFKNEKTQFKVALKKFLNAHSFYTWMNFSHVQMICITDYMTVQMYLTL